MIKYQRYIFKNCIDNSETTLFHQAQPENIPNNKNVSASGNTKLRHRKWREGPEILHEDTCRN